MNIIKVIKFDFSKDSLLLDYYQLFKIETDLNANKALKMKNVNRAIMIDLVKSGASLFYDSLHIGIAALILGKQIVNNEYLGNNSENESDEDIYGDSDNEMKNDNLTFIDDYPIKGLPPANMLDLSSYNTDILQKQGETESNSQVDSNNSRIFNKWLENIEKQYNRKINIAVVCGKLKRHNGDVL